jgi:hypothetical protein
MMHNFGCCPYCGNIVPGTVMETVEKPMRWITAERKWWQIWRFDKGEFEFIEEKKATPFSHLCTCSAPDFRICPVHP